MFCVFCHTRLRNAGLSAPEVASATNTVTDFIHMKWDASHPPTVASFDGTAAMEHDTDDLTHADDEDGFRFLTYAENERFIESAVTLAVRGMLTPEALDREYATLVRSSMIRGSIRQEYVTSEGLSRL